MLLERPADLRAFLVVALSQLRAQHEADPQGSAALSITSSKDSGSLGPAGGAGVEEAMKSYLETHGPALQALLTRLAAAQPENPFSFLLEELSREPEALR
jgi:hypothetical protein